MCAAKCRILKARELGGMYRRMKCTDEEDQPAKMSLNPRRASRKRKKQSCPSSQTDS
jgi:hypothetical protein